MSINLLIPPTTITFFTILAEYASRDTVIEAKKNLKNFKKLYGQAWLVSMFNIWILGVFIHWIVESYIIPLYKPYPAYVSFSVLTVSQSFGYYFAHKLMHKKIYSIHAFHHKFSKVVVPISGIAVSLQEFLFAYVLPVFISIFLAFPSSNVLTAFITLEYLFTLYIHTPNINQKSNRLFISPQYHADHHGKCPNNNFAAPILSIPDVISGTDRGIPHNNP